MQRKIKLHQIGVKSFVTQLGNIQNVKGGSEERESTRGGHNCLIELNVTTTSATGALNDVCYTDFGCPTDTYEIVSNC